MKIIAIVIIGIALLVWLILIESNRRERWNNIIIENERRLRKLKGMEK